MIDDDSVTDSNCLIVISLDIPIGTDYTPVHPDDF